MGTDPATDLGIATALPDMVVIRAPAVLRITMALLAKHVCHICSSTFSLLACYIVHLLTCFFSDCKASITCTGHGSCDLSTGQCNCGVGWAPDACAQCADNYYGNACDKCTTYLPSPPCHNLFIYCADCNSHYSCSDHGSCTSNGTCACTSEYDGSDCSMCSVNHFGLNCQTCMY